MKPDAHMGVYDSTIPSLLRAYSEKHDCDPSVMDVAKILKRSKSATFYHLDRLRKKKVVVLMRHGWRAS